jgi:hypothetical protein
MKKSLIITLILILILMVIFYYIWKLRMQAVIFRLDKVNKTVYIRAGGKEHKIDPTVAMSSGSMSYEISGDNFIVKKNGEVVKSVNINDLSTGKV